MDSHKTVHKPQSFWREGTAEAVSNRGPSAYHPNAFPLGQTGSLLLLLRTCLLCRPSIYRDPHTQTDTGRDSPKLEVEDSVATRLKGTANRPGSLCCLSNTGPRSLAPPAAWLETSDGVRTPSVPHDAVLPAICSQRARFRRRMLSLMWMSCLRSWRSCSLIASCNNAIQRNGTVLKHYEPCNRVYCVCFGLWPFNLSFLVLFLFWLGGSFMAPII